MQGKRGSAGDDRPKLCENERDLGYWRWCREDRQGWHGPCLHMRGLGMSWAVRRAWAHHHCTIEQAEWQGLWIEAAFFGGQLREVGSGVRIAFSIVVVS